MIPPDLPTIGKPRNGDNKTPCLTMLAKKQKQKNRTTSEPCKFAQFFSLPAILK
jgi:hypothetical protein